MTRRVGFVALGAAMGGGGGGLLSCYLLALSFLASHPNRQGYFLAASLLFSSLSSLASYLNPTHSTPQPTVSRTSSILAW